MASSAKSGEYNLANYKKIAHLNAAISMHLDTEYFERILQEEGDVNYDMIMCRDVTDTGANLNLLHSTYRYPQFDVFQLLLNHGADYTVKDSESNTVVHRIIHEDDNYETEFGDDKFVNSYVNSILSAHVKFENSTNPRCKCGISHFHAACMTNHVEAVEFFLKNGVSVDEAVNKNSSIFPGFTALHFAIRYACFKTVEILLKHGANVYLKNVAKMSAVHLLIERKFEESRWEVEELSENVFKILFHQYIDKNDRVDDGLSSLHVACVLKDTSIAEDILADKSLKVNQAIDTNAPICAGYTPLHFAANFNMNTLKLLLTNGADIESKDADNKAPFDICLLNHSIEDIHYIISSQIKWKDIKLSDGKTRLLDLVSAMISNNHFSKFLENFVSITDLTVPKDSPLWPGYTILHLAVIFSENAEGEAYTFGRARDTAKVEECLCRGADITKIDVNNTTALHLAFYLLKIRTAEVLLKHQLTAENPFDRNNLSHFHIACAAKDQITVERFLSNGNIDVNVPVSSTMKWHVLRNPILDYRSIQMFLPSGSTALHINVACGNYNITKMLLDNGADIYAKDCHGFTAIHRLITSFFKDEIADLLMSVNELRDSIADCGLSYLHVACILNKYDVVKQLLDSGADMDAVITYKTTGKIVEKALLLNDDCYLDHYGDPLTDPLFFLSSYNGFTPLFIAHQKYYGDIKCLLLQRGADILGGSYMKKVSPHDQLAVLCDFVHDKFSIDRLKNQFGMMALHIACYTKRLKWVKELLLQGEDVNAKCPFQPRNTSLHSSVLRIFEDGMIELIQLLLENGADVTLRNDNGETPLHLLENQFNLNEASLTDCKYARLLLKSIKKFDTNNADPQGISLFHFACILKDVEVVKTFLELGIDVNRPVSYHAKRYALCSPFHLVAGYQSTRFNDSASQMQIINLLLKHGADIHATDAFGNTPLHSAATGGSSRQILFDTFISNGLNVNDENILGQTALEILIESGNANWQEVQCLLKQGSRINSFNPITQEAYITKLFKYSIREEKKALANDVIRNLIKSEYVTEIDGEGHNFIHNIISIRYFGIADYDELIRQLVKRGCYINHQDKKGKTALHVATWFRNNEGILALMKNGADINVTDENGKTAFAYSFESPHKSITYENHSDPNHVINTFAMHVHKMERCGLYISEVNRRFQVDALEMYYLKEDVLKRFLKQINEAKSIEMGSTALTLHNFGLEKDPEMVYPSMPHFLRLEIDQFFENIRQHNLRELDYLLEFKYKKACERLRLINLAVDPFSIVIKNQLPELCCRVILSFLSSPDLENVIATEKL